VARRVLVGPLAPDWLASVDWPMRRSVEKWTLYPAYLYVLCGRSGESVLAVWTASCWPGGPNRSSTLGELTSTLGEPIRWKTHRRIGLTGSSCLNNPVPHAVGVARRGTARLVLVDG
jgi:hypothetical protein